MEENKNYSELPEEKAPVGNEGEEAPQVADGDVTPEGAAEEVEQAAEGAETPEDAADLSPATPEWSFGCEADVAARASNKRGTRTFIILLVAVFSVCVLLLGVTFFLGDGGIRLIRTLYTERTIFVREHTGEGGLLSAEEAADLIKKSTVTVSVRTSEGNSGHGSGFLYREESGYTYICTNNHVVAGMSEIQVVLADGTVYDATRVGVNADADVAVIKIAATGLPLVSIGSSADLLTGEDVFAVGTPANMMYAGTATFGKVSDPSRLVPMTDTSGSVAYKMTLIQTDTALNNGNSGGPLADMYGKVVGMVVLKLAIYNGDDVDGIAFALPIDGVKQIADEIIQKGSFSGVNPIAEGASALGLTGHGVRAGYWYSVDPSTNKVKESLAQVDGYHHADANGVYVMKIGNGYAGDKIFVGDIILKVNGLTVRDVTELIGAVNRHYIGETVSVTVWHNGVEKTVDVMLTEKTDS